MWVAVLEAEKLDNIPARVFYWGSPVVLFRTQSGKVGALEDKCSHRAIPLSQGKVKGESIRCDYHHFKFDRAGRCVEIPKEFNTTDEFQRQCTVRRYFAREELGLIWVSVEEDAPFPMDLDSLPEEYTCTAGCFEVDGDIRVWMDHFLDIPHCIWTHADTVYGGTAENPAKLDDMNIYITRDSTYPVRPAIDMRFKVVDQDMVSYYDFPAAVYSVLSSARRRVKRLTGNPEIFYQEVEGSLPTPLCQESKTLLGKSNIQVLAYTAINPVGERKNHFFYSLVTETTRGGPAGRRLLRKVMSDFVTYHLASEDGRLLDDAVYVDGDDFPDTDLDVTVRAMRAIFTRYQQNKAHLYAPDSLMHTLEYNDRKETDQGEASLQEIVATQQ